MKCSLHLIDYIILLGIVYCTPTSMGWLTAVTSSLTLNQFYHETRTNNMQFDAPRPGEKGPATCGHSGTDRICSRLREQRFEPRTIETDPDLKDTICHFIGSSGYFLMRGYEPVHMPPVLLQNEKIDVYNIHTRETVKEDAFPCMVVARSEDDTTALKFYISHEYDVSDSMLDLELGFSVGRFLFVYENDRFYCDALAEETALSHSRPEHDVERLYLEAKGGREIANAQWMDPLCRLDLDKKLRICAIVMNSIYFLGKVRFLPDVRKVKPECEIRQVQEIEGATTEIRSQEWMMACTVTQIQNNTEIEYHISRAYGHAKVFVYSVLNEERKVMVLENLSKQVGLVIDDGSQPSSSHPPGCLIN